MAVKVWIVAPWDYSGYAEPIGVFSTLEKAKGSLPADQDCNGINIFEMEIDDTAVLSTVRVD